MKQQTKNPPKTLQGQYAGFVSRFLAFFVDVLVVIAIITVVGITVDIIVRFFGLEQLMETLAADLLANQGTIGQVFRLFTLFGSITIISFAYFVLFWSISGGQSVGKALMGLRIVPLNGLKMSFPKSVLRYIAFLLSALILFIGLLWVLVSDRRQGWHDKIARTCVIYDWPAREDDGVFGTVKGRWSYLKRARERLLRSSKAPAAEADAETELAPVPEESTMP
jgi:uncharacterized RDD family membrane protein YckC